MGIEIFNMDRDRFTRIPPDTIFDYSIGGKRVEGSYFKATFPGEDMDQPRPMQALAQSSFPMHLFFDTAPTARLVDASQDVANNAAALAPSQHMVALCAIALLIT